MSRRHGGRVPSDTGEPGPVPGSLRSGRTIRPATAGQQGERAIMTAVQTRPAAQRAARRGVVVPLVFAAAALAILLALGTWQVNRLQWKLDLIERVESRVDAPPVPMPGPSDWPGLTDEAWDYRPVTVTGRFLPGELYYYLALSAPRGPLGGPGYLVYQPFATVDGAVVMVNRGFVPDGRRLPEARPGSAAPEGEVTLTGLWRRDERGNMMTLAPDLEDRIWFVRDAREMAAALGVAGAPVAPFTIDLAAGFTPPAGLPQAGETIVSFTNNHLQYAVTWYGLAAVLIAVTAIFLRRRLAARGAADGPPA